MLRLVEPLPSNQGYIQILLIHSCLMNRRLTKRNFVLASILSLIVIYAATDALRPPVEEWQYFHLHLSAYYAEFTVVESHFTINKDSIRINIEGIINRRESGFDGEIYVLSWVDDMLTENQSILSKENFNMKINEKEIPVEKVKDKNTLKVMVRKDEFYWNEYYSWQLKGEIALDRHLIKGRKMMLTALVRIMRNPNSSYNIILSVEDPLVLEECDPEVRFPNPRTVAYFSEEQDFMFRVVITEKGLCQRINDLLNHLFRILDEVYSFLVALIAILLIVGLDMIRKKKEISPCLIDN